MPFSGGLTIPEARHRDRGGRVCSSSKYSGSPAHGKITGTLTLPSTLKTIGAYAFAYEGFSGELLIPDGVTCIGANAFAECDELWRDAIPAGQRQNGGGMGVLSVRGLYRPEASCRTDQKLKSCRLHLWLALKTEVAIPEGVTEIGEGAFECSYMPSVRLPSTLKKIEKQAFMHAHNLTKITLPDGLETIGDEAFDGCRFKKAIVLPASIKSIGKKGVLWIFLLWKRYARRVFPRRSAPDCRDAERQLLVPVGLDALLPARHVRLDGAIPMLATRLPCGTAKRAGTTCVRVSLDTVGITRGTRSKRHGASTRTPERSPLTDDLNEGCAVAVSYDADGRVTSIGVLRTKTDFVVLNLQDTCRLFLLNASSVPRLDTPVTINYYIPEAHPKPPLSCPAR